MFSLTLSGGYLVVPGQFQKFPRNALTFVLVGSAFFFLIEFHASRQTVGGSGFVSLSVIYGSLSFTPRLRATTGVDLARFIYCLLQKIKQGSPLPLLEQFDQYVLANHSMFSPIADEEFMSGTRVVVVLNKIGSYFLQKVFFAVGRFDSSCKNLPNAYSSPLLPDPISGKGKAAFALQLSLVELTTHHFICLDCCLMGL